MRRQYKRGATLRPSGEGLLYELLSGCCATYGSGGMRELLRPGDFFEVPEAYVGACRALSPLELAVHEAADVAPRALPSLLARLTWHAELLEAAYAGDSERVLEHLLRTLAVAMGEATPGGGRRLSISQSQLGALCGRSRETVNRLLNALKEEGALELGFAEIELGASFLAL